MIAAPSALAGTSPILKYNPRTPKVRGQVGAGRNEGGSIELSIRHGLCCMNRSFHDPGDLPQVAEANTTRLMDVVGEPS